MGQAEQDSKADCRHRQGASHHEGEARIPVAKELEKVDDLTRVHHLRDREPRAEEDAGEERAGKPSHDQPPIPCRTTKTVTAPAAMKVIVAAKERGESRARPQTP